MLASENPLNFINGSSVTMEPVLRNCNKKEFHHIYPRSFLLSQSIPNKDINSLVNFSVISKADNNALGGVSPSTYKAKMPEGDLLIEIMNRALCPEDIFHDDYGKFVKERVDILMQKAWSLML
jgi:hypothetical protein